ncbi:Sphingosine kinase 2 [Cichlidogyrus casuarinus]|uniref:Sphingosine kinase 2 n=1 Tax=Cichlidogyrus casuarinus TaxID=1844966 RepID=A0ABD2QE56_9PLAT
MYFYYSENSKGKVTFSFLRKSEECKASDGKRFCPDIKEPVPSNWETMEGNYGGVTLLLQSHLSADTLVKADQTFGCGYISAFVNNEKTSRIDMYQQFDAFSSGYGVRKWSFLDGFEILAFRLTPLDDRKSYLVVDGEVIPYGTVQGEIIPGRFNMLMGPSLLAEDKLKPVNLSSVFPSQDGSPCVRTATREPSNIY